MGLSAASLLAEAGAKVVIASRSESKLEEAKKVIGRPVEVHTLDIKNEPQVSAFFAERGAFDHLVITAADAATGPFLEVPVSAAQDFFDSKFWGAYRVARFGAPHIAKDGSITFVSGAASQRGTPGLAAGSAINAALEALGRSLSVELAPIRVNTISPGLIETPVWDGIMNAQQKQAFFKQSAERLPTRRIGAPEEIAHAIRFVIENTYTTGSVVFVDGGYLQT
jgi:NAD(P)-dependent dehydrogenase (short-subunit alcohol dehydrogenase family)